MAPKTTSFLDLPPEVRLKIYRYLLLTRLNKCIEPIFNMAQHDLQPAILRTCGLIKQEASAVLYGENSFVHIVHDDALFLRQLRKNEVSLLCQRYPHRIDQMCSLEVTIITQPGSSSKKYHIMIASEDLRLMCTMVWTWLGRMHVDVLLDFSDYTNAIKLTQSRQDELLRPFKTLFRPSTILVKGAINQHLAAEVEGAPLKFISMSAVELLELMRSLRREGEQLHKAGNYRRGIMCLIKALDMNINHENIRGLRKPDPRGPWPGQSLWAVAAMEYFHDTRALSIMFKESQRWRYAHSETCYALKMVYRLKKSWEDCPISDEEIEYLERQKAEMRVKLALVLPPYDNDYYI